MDAKETNPLRFAFQFPLHSKAHCDYIVAAQPLIALIITSRFYDFTILRKRYGDPYPKGQFIIFSQVELVNFPVFIWSDRLSFAKKSVGALQFRHRQRR